MDVRTFISVKILKLFLPFYHSSVILKYKSHISFWIMEEVCLYMKFVAATLLVAQCENDKQQRNVSGNILLLKYSFYCYKMLLLCLIFYNHKLYKNTYESVFYVYRVVCIFSFIRMLNFCIFFFLVYNLIII